MGAVASNVRSKTCIKQAHSLLAVIGSSVPLWIAYSLMDATMHVTTTYTNTAVSIGTTILDTIDILPYSLQHLPI
jgi:hypothetical protein